ncbi:isocitrate lyase/PEP mutase family protein [Bowmanella dokdonensis]|uniref:Isocitrate lyase/phosphoenolpyruvate mutase family protein n=1 Tax=Bowmanella dokdonensis TaxID=751969 RepID=A0A939DP98_9ALTE|nr:isocitrate lyase/phosphoenolpyruvate mutase family protein [Bowmanella dokdonensis]MBN7825760.1 isocitrate lyase/phosphoenolpyruvate mutase family protein [Bowmanella dokdonensis]
MSGHSVQSFKALHQGERPLVLVNIWDAASAALVQAGGAQALATSSASLAWSLGYADGDVLPVQELLAAVGRIVRVARVPLTVDIEGGYSDDPARVAELARQLAHLGVAGINLEDGTGTVESLAEKIGAIRAAVADELFINARTDVYLRGLAEGEAALVETIRRLQTYRQAGADGGFVPGLLDEAIVAQLVEAVAMPLNLMVTADSTLIARMAVLGIRRFSMGPGPFLQAYGALLAQAGTMASPVESETRVGARIMPGTTNTELDFGRMNGLLG